MGSTVSRDDDSTDDSGIMLMEENFHRIQLHIPMPLHWKITNQNIITVKVKRGSNEFRTKARLILQSLPNCTVTSIRRVQNKYYWETFMNKKKHWSDFYGLNGFTEEYMFHGTTPDNIPSICQNNFDVRLHGTKTGHVYGRGVYFAKTARDAARYATGDPKVLFIVKVLVGRYTEGKRSIRKPRNDRDGVPYDTTVDDIHNPSIFVKYDASEFYPEYCVEIDDSESASTFACGDRSTQEDQTLGRVLRLTILTIQHVNRD